MYKPWDFSKERRAGPRKIQATYRTSGPSAKASRRFDIFHRLDIDPLHEALNPRLLSGFVSDLGRINPRFKTSLTWKSQRKMGKAIRRAKAIGILPQFSRFRAEMTPRFSVFNGRSSIVAPGDVVTPLNAGHSEE